MKTALKIMILLSAIYTIASFVQTVIKSNNDKAYDCKVLATYFEQSGYKTSAKYTAVVRVLKLNANTSIRLSPEGFYQAEIIKQRGQTVGYYFSDYEIDKITGDSNKYGMKYISTGFLLFAVFVILFVVKYV